MGCKKEVTQKRLLFSAPTELLNAGLREKTISSTYCGIITALLMLLSSLTFAQDDYHNPNNFYKFSADFEKEIAADTNAWKYQTGAMKFSIGGYYRKGLETWDKNPGGTPRVSSKDSALFKTMKQVNAKNYVLERSKSEKIIIINEAHHNAMHRWFTSSLLQGLYDNGYRYFGMEALFDSTINDRKFPVVSSGFYTREPEFGNLIKEALRIGFTLFGYEVPDNSNGKEREIGQARNIVKFMDTHKDGKLLLHAGFAHIHENEVRGWEKAMAGRLKEYTGIDPFTIDQEKFSGKSSPAKTHAFVNMISQKQATVLIDKNNQPFNGLMPPIQTDIVVIHPSTQYKDDRPGWMANGRKSYKIAANKISSYPALVLAYREGEFEKSGIPADIIEVNDAKAPKTLVLKPGRYLLVIKDRQYKINSQYPISIK